MRSRLDDLVATAAAEHGERPAVTAGDTTISYAALAQEISTVAGALRSLGVGRGERVAVYLDKRIETVTTLFGTAAAGGVFVPLNPQLRARQVRHVLADCTPTALVTSAERYALLGGDEGVVAKLVEHVVFVDDWGSFLALGDRPQGTSRTPSVTVDVDPAAIVYTSGSTGMPRGVVLSHRNLVAGAESVSSYLEMDHDDVILAALPLSFDAGFSQLTTSFAVSAHVVLMNYLLPGDAVRLCARHRVTGLTCVPPLWNQLADQTWPAEATASLRFFASTGGRMPRATLTRLRAILPRAKPFLMYGLTEAFRSTYLDPAEADRRPDSIGKAIPNAEILVVRPDGSVCDPGEHGELVHRGALVAMGYWNDPDRTAERFRPVPRPALPALAPGLCLPEMAVWSGDTVFRDDDGFLYFVGRRDEMIKTAGYRVSPTEVEEVAYDTGLVRDAVAVGIDDPQLGQRVALAVTPAEGRGLDRAALMRELKRQLPPYMVPRDVVVRPRLPRSPNGKFDRAVVRDELTSELAPGDGQAHPGSVARTRSR